MIDGVLILYNPNETILDNVLTYIKPLNRLWVIDNSEIKYPDLIERLLQIDSRIIYIQNFNRNGIAGALNLGIRSAIKNNTQWVLTMDQDSCFVANHIENFIATLYTLNHEKTAIISPCHQLFKEIKVIKEDFSSIDSCMTSGSLVNIEIFKRIGHFREEFFIDYVDLEYCLRARYRGYEIIKINSVILKHKLGNSKKHLKFILVTNHSPLRRYYITRNRFITLWEYKFVFPFYCLNEFRLVLMDVFKILIFEKQKSNKLKSTILGIFHFVIGKKGAFKSNV